MTTKANAVFDLRFDQPGDYTKEGFLVNSFEACKPMLDHIKAQGYSNVTLQTNIPIDIGTGKICLFDANTSFNPDKSLPKDFWKIAQYAKSIGLETAVRAEPVDYTNDTVLGSWVQHGPNFSIKEFFQSLVTYETALATKAQEAGVSSFYIGYMNRDFDRQDNLHYWQDLASSVRKVFSGKLAYTGFYFDVSPVLGVVDEPHMSFDPVLSKSASYDIKTIISKYSKPDSDVEHGADSVAGIKAIYDAFHVPIVLDDIRFDPGANTLGNVIDYFSLGASGIASKDQPNIELQTARITAFFELMRTTLSEWVDEFTVREYMPWMQSTFIRNPNPGDKYGVAFGRFSSLGFDLYQQPATEALYKHFIDGLSEIIVGSSGNDNIWVYAGNHTVDGGLGVDIVDLSCAKLLDVKISKSTDSFTLNWSGGVTSLKGVESIEFSDKTINLTVQAKAASAPQADVTRLVELYTAFFNRVPDADGMSFWIDEMKSGKTIIQVAESFYNAGVNYSSLTGFTATMKNTDFINVIYKNVLGRKDGADAGGLSFWDGALTSGQASRGTLVTEILNSAHTFKGNATWGWVADLLDNKITVAKKFSIDMGLNYNTPEESITKGMTIASAITPTDTTAAVTLIGVTEANLQLV